MAARRTTRLLIALAVVVVAFVVAHPYLDGAGLCGAGGCPEPSQSSSHAAHAGFSAVCMAAVLVASGTSVLAFASLLGRRFIGDHRRLVETYLSPDTPPPQVLLGR